MDTLTQVRQQLDTLLAQLVADRDALDAQEAVVARAFEQLSQTDAGQAAWRQGGDAMRWRCIALIDHQMAYLDASCISCTVLATLRRMLLEVEA